MHCRFLCCSVILPVLITASVASSAERPNVLLLCIDDLRPELGCFGVDYIESPNIDALAKRGRAFRRHYVQAPTCGASRFTLLTGRYGSAGNGALFARARQIVTDPDSVPASMPAYFRQHGYTTASVGKVSHHPGGRGGKDWDAEDELEMPLSWDRHLLPAGPWKHPRGAMHGLADGEIRGNAKQMDVFQSVAGPDTIYPDGLITERALAEMDRLVGDQGKPFFLAVGIIRPHLPFGAPAKYMEPYTSVELPPIDHPNQPEGRTTWHRSGEFMKYNRWGRDPNRDANFADEVRRHYAACVTYADHLVGRLIERLESHGVRDNTIVILWGDHGWHLGEHAIWGKHALFEESLRSPLVISYEGIPAAGQATDSIVETLDLFPTLCDLADLPIPKTTQGVSLRPILESPQSVGHPAISYTGQAKTIRTTRYRLILHRDEFAELYDHESAAKETRNIAAEHPAVVQRLSDQITARVP